MTLSIDIRKKPDPGEIKRNVKTARRLYEVLSLISPKSNKKHVISQLAVDLADLEAVGMRHKKLVKALCNMRMPLDREEVGWALARIEVDLLFEARNHLSSIKKLLPTLRADMRKSGRR